MFLFSNKLDLNQETRFTIHIRLILSQYINIVFVVCDDKKQALQQKLSLSPLCSTLPLSLR